MNNVYFIFRYFCIYVMFLIDFKIYGRLINEIHCIYYIYILKLFVRQFFSIFIA